MTPADRVLIYGNAGSGKTTMARRLADRLGVPMLSLDAIAWADGIVRRPIGESIAEFERFAGAHEGWIVEGCYGDLVEAALPRCTELRFLNPGTPVCIANCRRRLWEPDKFATAAEQAAMVDSLIEWVSRYETREDEFGLRRHRAIFDRFGGAKREYRSMEEAAADAAGWDWRGELGGG